MRASHWLLGLATSSTIVAAVASGCGGNSTSNPTDSGSTQDVTTEAAKEAAAEAAPDVAAEAAPCVPDAMIGNVTIPDSGADSGTAACLSCVLNACGSTLIPECNMICGCPQAFTAFEQCVADGGATLTCATTDLANAGIPLTSLSCALACASTCGVVLPGGDAGDAATETGPAPTDGGDGG
jgi:hypothetical protein